MNDLKLKLVLEAVDKASAELDKVRGEVSNVEKSASKAGAAFKAFGAVVSTIAFAKLAANFTRINIEFQKLNASLITVTGSQQAATAEFAKLEKFATTTPYQLNEVVGAFIKLKALGLKPSEEALRSYGNTASAMGKSLDQMIEAVADAATGEFERLRDFGIKASKQGERITFLFRGLKTEVANDATEITKYLRKIGDVDFASGMDRQMDTLGGAISNLKDNYDSLWRTVGNDGAAERLISAIHSLSKTLTSDGFVTGMSVLGQTLAVIVQVSASAVEALGDLVNSAKEIEKITADPGKGLMMTSHGIRTFERAGPRLDRTGTAVANSSTQKPGGSEISFDKIKSSDIHGPTWEDKLKLDRDYQADLDAAELKAARQATKELEASLLSADDAMAEMYVSLDLLNQPITSLNDGFTLFGSTLDAVAEKQVTWQSELVDSLDGLASYYDETFGDRMTGTVHSAFSTMEDSLVSFVTTGKAGFSDMVTSILADIARLTIQQSITGPLASALSGALGGLFNSPSTGSVLNTDLASSGKFNLGTIVPEFHDGGKVIPRFHYGGLARDEIPAILQTGERVLDREQNSMFEKLASNMGQPQSITIEQHFDLRNYNGEQQLVMMLRSAAEDGAKQGYNKVYEDFARRGPIARKNGW